MYLYCVPVPMFWCVPQTAAHNTLERVLQYGKIDIRHFSFFSFFLTETIVRSRHLRYQVMGINDQQKYKLTVVKCL